MTGGPLHTYRRLCRDGELRPDRSQLLAAEKLQSLHHALAGYRPERGRAGWKERLGLARRRVDPPQGLYLFGRTGRGKSMLMDIFFESAPVEAKRRVHFHEFMLEVHETLHDWRQSGRPHRHVDDLVAALAEGLAGEAWLLCFDEFVVNNIADAMLLGRLFQGLFDRGVVVVATSNFAPDDLYKDGLQRELFLPFIALFKERLDVLELEGAVDHRLARVGDVGAYHTPLGPEATRRLDAVFEALIDGAEPRPETIRVQGRELTVPLAARGVARTGFADLCEQPLGPADYVEIARRFRALVMDGVPRMGPERRNEARRFMVLVDALYERRTKLFCSAEAPPDALYPAGHGADEFRRTASRLMEMQGRAYMDLPHAGDRSDRG